MSWSGRIVCIVTCLFFSFIHEIEVTDKICRPKSFDEDSVVCECNQNHCDEYDVTPPCAGQYLHVSSNKDGLRFHNETGNIQEILNDSEMFCQNKTHKAALLQIDRDITFQRIEGFGGAFTDAAGYNIGKLSSKVQTLLMNSYFKSSGLNYNMARTPIGHTDFSLTEYYYDEEPYDVNMTNWKLADADFKYKIPYIKWAKKLAENDLHIISSLWTIPKWMRELDSQGLLRSVNEDYYNTLCLYIIKYLQAYQKEGIDMWAVGYANEPLMNLAISITSYSETVFTVWSYEKLEYFANKYFVPSLKNNGFNDVKVLFYDDNSRFSFRFWIMSLKKDKEIKKHIGILGVHAYEALPDNYIEKFHEEMPNVPVIVTELSAAVTEGVKLGKWNRAEFYAQQYLNGLNHYVSGWIDWNLALDVNSQPSHVNNKVDSPIIVDEGKNTFYKQPSYYAIGHFSKFILRGSVRIKITEEYPTDVVHGAVLRPDGLVAVVLLNKSSDNITVTIKDHLKGKIVVSLTAFSINTVLY